MKRLILLGCVALPMACAPVEAPDDLPYTERDSAGVTIVENVIPASTPVWIVSGEPTLQVGGMDALESEQLFQVRGARRLPDGRIALANSGAHEIRILSPEGHVLHTHGREGEGPGEFMAPQLVGLLTSDSLVVWDEELQRVTVVHVDDGVARTYQIQWNGAGFPVVRGLLGDGSLAIGGGMSFNSEDGFPTGVIRPESTFGWVTPAGAETSVGDFPAAEMFARANNQGFMARGLPFGRFSSAAATEDGMWIGSAESYELRRFGAGGSLSRILRLQAPPRPVTEDDVEAYIRVNVDEDAADENRRRELRAMTREMPIPEFLPPYQGLLVDSEGALWVKDYELPEGDTPRWTVFDGGGRILGRIETPARTDVLEVGPDYILGLTRDAFDVEAITLWSLTRSPT